MSTSTSSSSTEAALLALLVCAWPLSARAGMDDDPRALEARSACARGDVERGIKKLADYLATTDDLTAVYNMGRCYEQNGLADRALLQFREYLRQAKDLSTADRAEVEARIRRVEGEVRPPAPLPAPDLAATGATTAAPPTEPRSPLRPVAIAVAGAGVASVAVGAYFGLRTRALERQVANAPAYDAGDYQAGRTAHTLQFVMYGIGAAAVAAGGVLYYLASRPEPRLALLPALSATAVGALLRVRL
jgi:hypothetical protein